MFSPELYNWPMEILQLTQQCTVLFLFIFSLSFQQLLSLSPAEIFSLCLWSPFSQCSLSLSCITLLVEPKQADNVSCWGISAWYKIRRSRSRDPLGLVVVTASDGCGLSVSQSDRTWFDCGFVFVFVAVARSGLCRLGLCLWWSFCWTGSFFFAVCGLLNC